MLAFRPSEKTPTIVMSMRMTVDLADWIQRCAGERKRSTAAVIMLNALRQTMPDTDLDSLLRDIQRSRRQRDNERRAPPQAFDTL
jgi:hypothetical protein